MGCVVGQHPFSGDPFAPGRNWKLQGNTLTAPLSGSKHRAAEVSGRGVWLEVGFERVCASRSWAGNGKPKWRVGDNRERWGLRQTGHIMPGLGSQGY